MTMVTMIRFRFLMAIALMLLFGGVASAQFGRRLGEAVKRRAEDTVIRKAEDKTEKAIDAATDPDTYESGDEEEEEAPAPAKKKAPAKSSPSKSSTAKKKAPAVVEEDEDEDGVEEASTPLKAAETAYAKSDFVPGDEIIFSDEMDGEQLGEFPSQWDLLDGTSEVASVNGKKALELNKSQSKIMPLMKTPKNFLGDVWTIEFDVLVSKKEMEYGSQWFTFEFLKPDDNDEIMAFSKSAGFTGEGKADGRITWSWHSTMGGTNGDDEIDTPLDIWHHFAISFNKRAYKIYVNGVRVSNVPNVVTPPGWFWLRVGNGDGHTYFTNFRIAKGAVPLYDRLTTDGKIITYGITFDVGKATIKPESLTEINRIVKLLNEKPDLKFSVEGHTDSTGTAAANQTLSDARSKAVVDKLVEMGIAANRLTSAGKGQSAPIADNGTDEGRAKNRRVEFVKTN